MDVRYDSRGRFLIYLTTNCSRFIGKHHSTSPVIEAGCFILSSLYYYCPITTKKPLCMIHKLMMSVVLTLLSMTRLWRRRRRQSLCPIMDPHGVANQMTPALVWMSVGNDNNLLDMERFSVTGQCKSSAGLSLMVYTVYSAQRSELMITSEVRRGNLYLHPGLLNIHRHMADPSGFPSLALKCWQLWWSREHLDGW